jgi:hypothetical protein
MKIRRSNIRHRLFALAGCIAASVASEAYADPLPVVGAPTPTAYTPLQGPSGTLNSTAINQAGMAVGFSSTFHVLTSPTVSANRGARGIAFDANTSRVLQPETTATNGTGAVQIYGINDAGYAVGYWNQYTNGASARAKPIVWNLNDNSVKLLDLGSAPLSTFNGISLLNSAAMIAANGDIIGNIGTFSDTRTVRWSAATGQIIEQLSAPLLGITTNEIKGAINSAGTVVAIQPFSTSYNGSSPESRYRAVRWDRGATTTVTLQSLTEKYLAETPLAIPPGQVVRTHDDFAYVNDLNESNVAVGLESVRFVYVSETNLGTVLNTVDRGARPVRWYANGNVEELIVPWYTPNGTAGSNGGDTESSARAINDYGVTVGFSPKWNDVDGNGNDIHQGQRALRWNAGSTTPTVLNNLGVGSLGETTTVARDINNAGYIVGTASDYTTSGANGAGVDVFWRPDGSIVNLNSLIDPASGWVLSNAERITDTGWIAGEGRFDPDGPGGVNPYTRAYSLYVPEASWYKLGDFNFDGIVNNLDIQPMLNALTNAEAYYASIPGLNSYDAQWFQTLVGDLNDDNLFNNLDIQAMLDYLTSGQSLTAAGSGVIFLGGDALEVTAVPEPTTWAALGLTLLGGLAYRRRQRTAS